MSYELEHGKSLGENLQRICRKQIEGAIAVARGKDHAGDSIVHGTRKHLKKARAALRLVRGEIGKGLYRQQHRALRDAGRLISDLRDAEVRLQTVRQLEGIAHRRELGCGKLETMLSFELENFMAAFAGWQAQAVPMLEEARKKVDCWVVDQVDGERLVSAVQFTYKCARTALRRARVSPEAENFHEFRSQAKRLCLQLRILRPINAVVLKSLSTELAAVSRLLGQAHDLSFLGQRLRHDDGKSQWRSEAEKLLCVVETGEGQLQHGAAELAEHFFLERPRDFGRRLSGWLEDWQQNRSPSMVVELI